MRLRRTALYLSAAALAMPGALAAQEAPIVQPGAPGTEVRVISAEEASRQALTQTTPADAAFMRHMIEHHAQALTMADLVEGRTASSEVVDTAERIRITQDEEIGFMRGWLAQHGEPVADPHAGHHGHHGHMGHTMPGMLTPAQLEALAAARGPAFDRLFLQLMIEHHQGAILMVEELREQPGSMQDPALFDFTSEVVADQEAEIARMSGQLASLSTDPRVGLAAGFRDAGEAAWNMALVTTRPNPPGFFDPANQSGVSADMADGILEGEESEEGEEVSEGVLRARQFATRAPLLNFGNTDMAFAGDLLAAGSYHGFHLYRLGADGTPTLVSSVVCPGGQGDVSIVGSLLLMSVEQERGRVDCGTGGVAEDVSAERFRGLRIFDISDPVRPRQVGGVQTCRGSHTHSVVTLPTAARPSFIVYNSGTAGVREGEELPGCVGEVVGDERTALFSIDVIEVPVANPAAARIIDSPRVFADDEGNIAGLWLGGDHGPGTQTSRTTDQCHDITVFPSKRIAAGACSGNGIVLDISDPMQPRRVDAVVDRGFAYWHSATFNNDGTKVVFTDEWGGGVQPRCQASDPAEWGANALFDIQGERLERRATYKLPAPQTAEENCVAHNGSIVPVPGRDLMVQAWYQGGLSLFDFTDSNAPREIAFFDRGPIHAEQQTIGGYWSAYYHRGHVYATEIVRGLDVFRLQPSEHLSANEIAAAALAEGEDAFNPQRQTPVTWPAHPVVALAYLDQLERAQAMPAERIAAVRQALTAAQPLVEAGRRDAAAGRALQEEADGLRAGGLNGADAKRAAALEQTLRQIAARLRG